MPVYPTSDIRSAGVEPSSPSDASVTLTIEARDHSLPPRLPRAASGHHPPARRRRDPRRHRDGFRGFLPGGTSEVEFLHVDQTSKCINGRSHEAHDLRLVALGACNSTRSRRATRRGLAQPGHRRFSTRRSTSNRASRSASASPRCITPESTATSTTNPRSADGPGIATPGPARTPAIARRLATGSSSPPATPAATAATAPGHRQPWVADQT